VDASGEVGTTPSEGRRRLFEDRDMWMYRTTSSATIDLTGFEVEAVDGSIGHVDSATEDIGVAAVVVDTGPWIFGRKTRSTTLRSTTQTITTTNTATDRAPTTTSFGTPGVRTSETGYCAAKRPMATG
jgi:hypothetical protein